MSVEANIGFFEQFDDAFFAEYDVTLEETDRLAMATDALGGILTIQSEDGEARSYEQILDEVDTFMANELVQRDLEILNAVSVQFALFAQQHQCPLESMGSHAVGALARGMEWLGSSDNANHLHTAEDDEEESDN